MNVNKIKKQALRKFNKIKKQAVRKFNTAKRKALRTALRTGKSLSKKAKRGAKSARSASKITQLAAKKLLKSLRVKYKRHKDRDKNYRKRLREIKKLAAMKINVGVLSRGNAPKGSRSGKLGGLTVAQVGMFHEFGLGVPRRSFIRDWYDPNVARIKARSMRVSELVVAGTKTAQQAGALLGMWAQGEIQNRISDGIGAPLARATILRKGSSKQLIDTGQLRSSITFEVTL